MIPHQMVVRDGQPLLKASQDRVKAFLWAVPLLAVDHIPEVEAERAALCLDRRESAAQANQGVAVEPRDAVEAHGVVCVGVLDVGDEAESEERRLRMVGLGLGR